MNLLPGDILLWRVTKEAPWFGRLIGWGERLTKQANSKKRSYYHVGFCGAHPGYFYESRPPRICISVTPDPLPPYIEAYRVKGGLTNEQLERIFAYAKSRLGAWYNFLGILTLGYLNVAGDQFCSQFTNDAFTFGGIVLAPQDMLESPDDLAASSILERIV
jgi:hypothetical protein